MRFPSASRRVLAAVGMALVLRVSIGGGVRAEPAPTAALRSPASQGHTVLPRAKRARGPSGGSSGWWLGSAGIALVLAVFGGLSLAARRYLPAGAPGSLRVLGRTGLSPKHSVYLLQVGDRVLILGAGPQGPPALLGELDEWPIPGRPVGASS